MSGIYRVLYSGHIHMSVQFLFFSHLIRMCFQPHSVHAFLSALLLALFQMNYICPKLVFISVFSYWVISLKQKGTAPPSTTRYWHNNIVFCLPYDFPKLWKELNHYYKLVVFIFNFLMSIVHNRKLYKDMHLFL